MKRFAITLGAAILATAPAVAPALADDCQNAQTQMALDDCAGQQFHQADAALNTAYKTLMGKITPAGQTSLRVAEKSWLAYRDNQCSFETLGTADGSVHPMVQAACRTELTKAQTARLHAQLTCTEGDLSCGGQ